jgi:hypothetical protein
VLAGVGLGLTSTYVSVLFTLMQHTPYDTWGPLIVTPVLILVSLPALSRHAEREGDPVVFRMLLLALFVRLGGSIARYFVAFSLYGGVADATQYHTWGVELSSRFWHGNFHTGLESLSGTDFMRLFTGIVYSVIGPSKLGGFLFFSWLSFWGLFFLYRAFVIAVPEGQRSLYGRLLFFLPSLVFWASSIGKEAWMILGLGIACLGIARLLCGQLIRGFPLTLVGLWMMALVRPHVAGMVALAFVVGVLVKRPSIGLRQLAPAVKIVSLAAVAVLAGFLVVRTDRFLQDEGVRPGAGFTSTLRFVGARTGEGGSDFQPSIVDTPTRTPVAVVTVLYRPFLSEAHNTQALLAAAEATALLALSLLRWRSIVAAVRDVRNAPYLAFAMAYVAMFIVGFSSIANFGILARQRVQMYPLFLVLLAVRPSDAHVGNEAEHR